MSEELLKQLVEHQVEFSTGMGYPGAPYPEDVVRELKEQGVELPPEPAEEVEERVLETVESTLDKFCKIVKSVEIADKTGDYGEGIYIYRCHHPKIGSFFVYLGEKFNEASGENHKYIKFTRNEAEALQRFANDLESILDEYDVDSVEELARVLEEKGLNVWYRI